MMILYDVRLEMLDRNRGLLRTRWNCSELCNTASVSDSLRQQHQVRCHRLGTDSRFAILLDSNVNRHLADNRNGSYYAL